MRLEHSTIPLYLSALHSIHPSTNVDATGILKMVTAGEMLHLTLVVNMLHAVGGAPDLTVDGFVARYPTHLPDGESDFKVSIKPFSPAAIRTFLQIECPMSLTSDIDFVNRSSTKLQGLYWIAAAALKAMPARGPAGPDFANNGAGKTVPAVRENLAGLAHRLLDDLAVRAG